MWPVSPGPRPPKWVTEVARFGPRYFGSGQSRPVIEFAAQQTDEADGRRGPATAYRWCSTDQEMRTRVDMRNWAPSFVLVLAACSAQPKPKLLSGRLSLELERLPRSPLSLDRCIVEPGYSHYGIPARNLDPLEFRMSSSREVEFRGAYRRGQKPSVLEVTYAPENVRSARRILCYWEGKPSKCTWCTYAVLVEEALVLAGLGVSRAVLEESTAIGAQEIGVLGASDRWTARYPVRYCPGDEVYLGRRRPHSPRRPHVCINLKTRTSSVVGVGTMR